ncbi:flagellar basal-body rod protein FlgG [beta proteobacterium AAP51]|nr:flagellar basal-body rod protein FlgG [beta proteobacterium AAP51]
MIRSLWIAKTGMEGQQNKLDAISHNLANVGTNGFKRGTVQFEDLMYQNLRPAGAAVAEQTQLPTGLQVGLGVRTAASVRNFTQGALQNTGNNLDLAIQGQGFFQIQMPDGSTGYTRDGSFQLDAGGQMVTNQGYVLQPGITVPANAISVNIAPDGQVQATIPGQTALQNLGQIQLANFINPAGLDSRGGNLFAETAASGAPQAAAPDSNGLGRLQRGYLEGSNVNVVEELVSMIATQRAYELNSKAITTSDQMLQRLGQL